MAQYFTDFSSTDVGNQPSDTTLRRSSASGDFTKQTDNTVDVLRYLAPSGGTAARGIAFDDAASSGVVEAVTELRDVDNSVPPSARLLAYATDSPEDEYGAILDVDNDRVTIYRRVSGSFTELARKTSVPMNSSDYYMLRFRVTPGSPNQIQARTWDSGTTEPATWDLDTTDGNLTLTSGWTGVLGFTVSDTVYYRMVGIGTDGDPAPTEAVEDFDPANLQATVDGDTVSLSWDASPLLTA